jgi:hypothetical protein
VIIVMGCDCGVAFATSPVEKPAAQVPKSAACAEHLAWSISQQVASLQLPVHLILSFDTLSFLPVPHVCEEQTASAAQQVSCCVRMVTVFANALGTRFARQLPLKALQSIGSSTQQADVVQDCGVAELQYPNWFETLEI